jgi:hypothetical protein
MLILPCSSVFFRVLPCSSVQMHEAARALESGRTSALAARDDAAAAAAAAADGDVPLAPSRLEGWGKAASPALETGRILEYVRRTGMPGEPHERVTLPP